MQPLQLTPFAYFFLPALFGIVLFARVWLPVFVLFASVFQATSVINVPMGDALFGITPYHIAALAAACVFVTRFTREPNWRTAFRQLLYYRAPSGKVEWPVKLLFAYFAVAVAGAFVLPHVFSGLPVYSLVGGSGFDGDTTPLAFGLSNVAQAINLCVHAVVLLFLLQCARRPEWRGERLLWGLGAGIALAITVNFYERAVLSLGWPPLADFWVNNPGYSLVYQSWIAGIPRIAIPFSEPSYASAFFASTLVAALLVAVFGNHALAALTAAALAGLALLNTLGLTGLAAGAAGMFLVFLLLVMKALKPGPSDRSIRKRALIASCGLFFIAALTLWAGKYSSYAPQLQALYEQTVTIKLKEYDPSGRFRARSNIHALNLLRNTYGFGTGLGGNRASSYQASLISNAGLPGFLLLNAALLCLLWRYIKTNRLTDKQLLAAGALLGATLAVSSGIPDLNIPFYWGFIFLAFLLRPELPLLSAQQSAT